mgnify:CR=1 FL=1
MEAITPWLFGVAGLVTMSMLQAVVAPKAALRVYFGEQTDSPGLLAIVRNWGAGIAACGGLLLAAAFVPEIRVAAAVFAIVTKLAFIVLVLGPGRTAAQRQAKLAVVFDVLVIAVLVTWLILR